MVMSLHQRTPIGTGTYFTLRETGVSVEEKSIFTSRRYDVSFETIPNDGVEVTTSSKTAFTLAGVGLVVGVFQLITQSAPFYLALGALCAAWYWWSRRSFVVFHCGERTLVFRTNLPSHEEVAAFLGILQEQKHDYIRKNYPPTRTGSLVDDLQKLAWLKSTGCLTEEEFARMKASLLNDVKGPRGEIGFGGPSSAR